jgi:hypothetical protein
MVKIDASEVVEIGDCRLVTEGEKGSPVPFIVTCTCSLSGGEHAEGLLNCLWAFCRR